jgi:hypothetical protein
MRLLSIVFLLSSGCAQLSAELKAEADAADRFNNPKTCMDRCRANYKRCGDQFRVRGSPACIDDYNVCRDLCR